ncbi:MAG: serine dehydratase [Planctomycetaceae bacterium]|nr:serine dehydratase [Planctomycetaceae bacterium]|tara:strand:+ start:1487 stop:2461 length:975 start_codon:yes stop_codon:yes gene_type:complete
MNSYATDLSTIYEAYERIKNVVHRTPVQTCRQLSRHGGADIHFKCENLQKVGAFKYRGASNVVLSLSDQQASAGVVTHSSGNHAQALALAAEQRGIPAHIVMPSNAPQVKQDAVAGYGARIILCEPTLESRETTAAAIVAETDATFIHPYNHAGIISGQATVALELFEQVSNLDVIIAPVGGGGLLSGIAIAAKAINPAIRIVGAEPAGADDAFRSKASGQLIAQTSPNTVADGLLTSLGDLTWPVVRDLVDEIVVVDDFQIISAMKLIMERAKILTEPSGAVSYAAAVKIDFESADTSVACVISGGNMNLSRISELIENCRDR